MDPLTAIASAAESAAEVTAAAKEFVLPEADFAFPEGIESAAEAREAVLGEQGLIHQLDTIRFDSFEALSSRNEAAFLNEPAPINEEFSIEANCEAGRAREAAVHEELMGEYTPSDGYHIETQCPIRDETGRITVDPETGEHRRLDYVVMSNGEVVRSIEVTSETADKAGQMAKEARIHEAGGNFVVDRRTGELVRFADGVKTEIARRP